MRRVVITGMGCVSPYGTGLDPFWEGLVAGRSAIRSLTAFDSRPYGSRVAGEVLDFRPQDFLPRKDISSSARCTQLGIAASRMALDESRLSLAAADASRTGVFLGTSVGTAQYLAENHAIFLEKGIRRVHPLFPAQSYPGVIATQLAINLGIRGPALCISTACTSATDAIGIAWLYIRNGLIDRAIVGGSEAPLTPILFASFDRLGVLSRENEKPERSSRPFAADRDGFVLSEGAGACILESEEAALERGASIVAEVSGYGATSDGFHPFSPLPSGEEGVRAISLALEQAGRTPGEVDYVNAHAIGSKPNDPIEIEIVKQVFQERAPLVAVSSIKSMIGHTMGAAGALELIACARSIQRSIIPPTINLGSEDYRDQLDLVPDRARPRSVRVALSPTFGFGSRNAVLVVEAYDQ